jgi:hypothetical protein
MKRLVVLFAVVLAVSVSANAACGDTTTFQNVTCACGGVVQIAVCKGSGSLCDQLSGPLVQCGSSCYAFTSGDCLSGRVLDLRSPSLMHVAQSFSGCGAPGQINFTDWLKNRLEGKTSRSS